LERNLSDVFQRIGNEVKGKPNNVDNNDTKCKLMTTIMIRVHHENNHNDARMDPMKHPKPDALTLKRVKQESF